ncbi:hypothetical protein B0H19DRAFT_236332 [Mycena capillaripes]|nr:hypothetical protein B0H19DRAFT_236332 [Mycena capillaripes]
MLASLEADRARVAELEAQILALEPSGTPSALHLEIEKALVQERLDSYKYPVLTLPNEIISEVFIHCLPTYPLCPSLRGPFSPNLLIQICRKWREIALTTPALWRSIAISSNDAPSLVPHVRMWLDRSRCCPFSIWLKDVDDRWGQVPEILAVLVSHRTRWEHVDLHLSLSHVPTISGPMPLLRHLKLSLRPTREPSIFTFPEMPLLRTVTLNYIAAQNIILPWAQLTSLTLQAVAPREYGPLLRQTLNLVHCRLDIFNDEEIGMPEDIKLSSLESLILEGETLTGCLETFVLPALRSLQIPPSFLTPKPIDILTSFISKSGCKLHEVRIVDVKSIAQASYREAFPSILFSFTCLDFHEAD